MVNNRVKNILDGYYQKILEGLKKDLSDIYASSEAKGTFNVVRFKEVVKKHLPQLYSFASAEIFDREGAQTECKDFVAYDTVKNVNLVLPGSGPFILPVDVVLSVFEIKTSLNRVELRRAIQQVQEVKKLSYLKRTVKVAEYVNSQLCDNTYQTTPPLGIVVAYQKSWSDKTNTFYENLFEESKAISKDERWDIFYVIEDAFIAVKDVRGDKVEFIMAKNISDENNKDTVAGFLNFLLILNNRLKQKIKTIYEIDFREDYDLGQWLWRMEAVSYTKEGPLPREES